MPYNILRELSLPVTYLPIYPARGEFELVYAMSGIIARGWARLKNPYVIPASMINP